MAHDVFISYSTEDKPAADAVCAILEKNGVRSWIAPRDIMPGADWGESIVNANISRIARGRTMIIISHRLTSLVESDAILVLERGQVHDIGKHQELLARCDIYSDLWHQQTRNVLSSVARKPALRSPTLVS